MSLANELRPQGTISARFRYDFMTVGSGTKAVCGAVNSPNSYGGYVGMERFYVEFTDGQAARGGLVGSSPGRYRNLSVVEGFSTLGGK